jgi:HEAT repeat protein
VLHLAAFAIGNVGGPDSADLLKVMLLDGDRFARANAAVGLARNGSTDGVPVLVELLNESLLPFDASAMKGKTVNEIQLAENNFLVEQPSLVRTCLRAVSDLWPRLSDPEKAELKTVVEKISADFFAPQVRIQADELLRRIAGQ